MCDVSTIPPGFPVRLRPTIKDDNHRTNGEFLMTRESVYLTQHPTESSLWNSFFHKRPFSRSENTNPIGH